MVNDRQRDALIVIGKHLKTELDREPPERKPDIARVKKEADIAAACARLARFGIDGRHLRTFLTGAGRQAALIEQLVAPGLRSRNTERRKNALDDLEALSRVAQELSHLLLVRDLRTTVERTG